MTTAATVVGHFPLVLATGPGAGARNSIGIMLVSGMIVGTLFTLLVVPSIYMLVARKRAVLAPAAAAPEMNPQLPLFGLPPVGPSVVPESRQA
jgi:multidrug efflux pump